MKALHCKMSVEVDNLYKHVENKNLQAICRQHTDPGSFLVSTYCPFVIHSVLANYLNGLWLQNSCVCV